MLVAEASLAISILSISAGLMEASGLFEALPPTLISSVITGTPSITTNGYELNERELVPLILKTGAWFTTPELAMMLTPVDRPFKVPSKL